MDWMEQEQERGITITSAATTCLLGRQARSTLSTRPDTSTSRSKWSARCACSMARLRSRCNQGVEPQTETVWRQGDKYNVPRMIFVNKMDKIGADFYVRRRHQERLGAAASAAAPHRRRSTFKGIVDLVRMKAMSGTATTKTPSFHREDIPADLATRPTNIAPAWSRSRSRWMTTASAPISTAMSRMRRR